MQTEVLEQPVPRVGIGLVHYPVVNRRGETIASALTNLDIHDIARASKTYGLTRYWLVIPFAEQQELARQLIGHWTEGHGSASNPDRAAAFSLVQIVASLDAMLAEATEQFGQRPLVLATCAKKNINTRGYKEIRSLIWQGQPTLLLFGTAWGLHPDILDMVDATLPPIVGPTSFNHLSVRSAASIILDRLLGIAEE